jgi:hypothetical protein
MLGKGVVPSRGLAVIGLAAPRYRSGNPEEI